MANYLDAYFSICRKVGYRCNGRDRPESVAAVRQFFYELGFPKPVGGPAPDVALAAFSWLYLMHNLSTWVFFAKYTGRAGLTSNPQSYDQKNLGGMQLYDQRVETFDIPSVAESLFVMHSWRKTRLDRRLAELARDVLHLQNQTLGAYSRAPAFNNVFPLLEEMFSCGERNVAEFNRVTLEALASLVGIKCLFKVSSRVPKADELRGRDRVIDLCRALGATTYINPIGGLELYKQRDFENYGIDLVFLKARITEYNQFGAPHVPFLSIIDVLMFNAGASLESIVRHGYDLVRQ